MSSAVVLTRPVNQATPLVSVTAVAEVVQPSTTGSLVACMTQPDRSSADVSSAPAESYTVLVMTMSPYVETESASLVTVSSATAGSFVPADSGSIVKGTSTVV